MTMSTYGHQIDSDNDPFINLVTRATEMTVQSGSPGGTPVDFFPSCMRISLLQECTEAKT